MAIEHARAYRAADLWLRTTSDATRVAVLMGSGVESARRISGRTFRRASWLWMDHRDERAFEVWLLRTVIRASNRFGLFRRRRASHESPLGAVTAGESELWSALQSLRPRLRAALVLAHYKGMGESVIADVLQTSARGAAALLARAERQLELRDNDVEGFERFLARVADRVPTPSWDLDGLGRAHRLAKFGGVLLFGLAVIGSAVAVVLVVSGLPGTSPSADSRARVLDDFDDPNGPEIPPSELLGVPDWCPSPKGLLPLKQEDAIPAVGVASRFNVGLLKDYRVSIRHLFERPPGAPNPFGWPSTTDDEGIRVVASVPAEANRLLAANCGHFIARRTWEVVLEHPGHPHNDGVAFFLVHRSAGLNVWGSYAGSAQ